MGAQRSPVPSAPRPHAPHTCPSGHSSCSTWAAEFRQDTQPGRENILAGPGAGSGRGLCPDGYRCWGSAPGPSRRGGFLSAITVSHVLGGGRGPTDASACTTQHFAGLLSGTPRPLQPKAAALRVPLGAGGSRLGDVMEESPPHTPARGDSEGGLSHLGVRGVRRGPLHTAWLRGTVLPTWSGLAVTEGPQSSCGPWMVVADVRPGDSLPRGHLTLPGDP